MRIRTLAWTLFLIAQHPQVAHDLVDEISHAVGQAHPTLDRVADLPLLGAVVRESMRLLPPVPFQIRVAMHDTQLGLYEVKGGTRVILSPYLTNRLPALYDLPGRFRPERWCDMHRSAFEYMSFSAGPRTCPGYWFGMSVVKVAIAAILSRFRIAVVAHTRIDRRIAITMTPRQGLPMVLHPAGGAWSAAPVSGQICDMLDFRST